MSTDEIIKIINEAEWFSNISNYIAEDGTIAIKTLKAWEEENTVVDEYHEYVADNMKWLPSQSNEPDPIYGDSLKTTADELGLESEMKEKSFEIYKLIMVSLRNVDDHKLLIIGNHNFNKPSKASVAYAGRLATSEIIVGKNGFWCKIFELFSKGYLPCGIMPDGKIVVY